MDGAFYWHVEFEGNKQFEKRNNKTYLVARLQWSQKVSSGVQVHHSFMICLWNDQRRLAFPDFKSVVEHIGNLQWTCFGIQDFCWNSYLDELLMNERNLEMQSKIVQFLSFDEGTRRFTCELK